MKNHYRDAIYLWMAMFVLPMLGAIVCAVLLFIGGDNSHLHFYSEGFVQGNINKALSFEDLTWIMFLLIGMSAIFNLFLFTKERKALVEESPILQVAYLLICIWITVLIQMFCKYPVLGYTLSNADKIHLFTLYGSMLAVYSLISSLYGILKLLPAAKKADKINFDKLLNYKK